MGLIVPDVVEAQVLNMILNDLIFVGSGGLPYTLRLYSNDYTPIEGSTAASFTEVAGGGYAAKTLTAGSWVQTPGDPTVGVYPIQTFLFTGPTSAPTTIYGYYILNAGGLYRWGERFPAIFVPFIPTNGSQIRITPRLEVS